MVSHASNCLSVKLRQLLIVSLCLFIFSCKKNDSGLSIDLSIYSKSGIRANGNFRIFSQTGEITDPFIVSRFNLNDTFDFVYMEDVTGNSPSVMKYIKFSDAQHAEVADQDTLRSCVVSEDGANIILTRTDTSIGSTFANELTRHIIYYIGEVKPEVYSEYLISSTRGSYVFGYRAREKFVLLQSEGQILAPFIGFKQHIGGGPGIPMYINNNLQTDFYKNIESGDTVTLKEYFLTYRK